MWKRQMVCIMFLLFSCDKATARSEPDSTASSPLHSMKVYSTAVKDTFVIDVSLPESYSSSGSIRYPVLYLTDGYWRRGQHQPIHAMAKIENIQEMIIVGIGYPDSYDPNTIRLRDLIHGADRFLSFILHQVIPSIDSTYRTLPAERTLWGASYGGYFTMYTLFRSADIAKDIFKNFIVASAAASENTPSNNQEENLFDYEVRLSQKTATLQENLYITVGGNETSYFISSFDKLVSILTQRKYKGFFMKSFKNPGKDHFTVWEPTLYEGIRLFLKK